MKTRAIPVGLVIVNLQLCLVCDTALVEQTELFDGAAKHRVECPKCGWWGWRWIAR